MDSFSTSRNDYTCLQTTYFFRNIVIWTVNFHWYLVMLWNLSEIVLFKKDREGMDICKVTPSMER